MSSISKRSIVIIIGILIVIAVFSVFLFTLSTKNQVTKSTPPVTIVPSPTPYIQSLINFFPSALTVPTGSIAPLKVNLTLTTGADNDTGVQLILTYNPQLFSSVTIDKGTFFSNPIVLERKVDTQAGTISYIYAITPSQKPYKGSGTIAVLTLVPVADPVDSNDNKVTRTTIQLSPKSEVTALGVLNSTLDNSSFIRGLTINFQ